jgi:RNA polymerase sigma-70 factor, ECF subfamily
MGSAGTQLDVLYREVGPALLTYLVRCSGDAHAAEDLLQETFLHAARRLERVAEAVSPRAWLFGIARHLVLTARRRRRLPQPLAEAIPATSDSPDPRLEAMGRAISELPEPMRETLELRLRAELAYDEIAAVLDIPVGTVRSRLHQALQRLRAALVETEV